MKFPFFASFLVFIAWLTFNLHRSRQNQASADEAFWYKEYQANNTRRKSLDDLAYITIPLDMLPMNLCSEDIHIADYIQTIKDLATEKIVNLTGISNTDLKLQYGAPNINLLMRYDGNYIILARTLQAWANALYEKGYDKEAQNILEFAISTHTDVRGTYSLLCEIYKKNNALENIPHLRETANSLLSTNKDAIVHILDKYDQ